MNARFGRDVDPEELPADDRRSLDSAAHRYDVFHKKEPRRTVALSHAPPAELGLAGQMLSVMYRTDKWADDGDDTDYKHVDDPGVKLYLPWGSQPWLEPERPPLDYPRAFTLLGKHMGTFIERVDTGEIFEGNPRNTFLFSAPDGKMLFIYHPKKGFLAVMAGGGLRVEAEGIDG